MKRNVLLAVMLVCSFMLVGVAAKAHEWKEKDEFHKVIAATFHPSEEGNFEPIRSRVGELYDKAVAWSKSTPPADFNKPEIKTALKELVDGIAALKAMVEKKATNDELKPKLEAVHETFHKIVGLCTHDDGKKMEEGKKK